MIRRKYELWITYERRGKKVGESFVCRHWTRRGAKRLGDTLVHHPRILAKTMESLLSDAAVDAEGVRSMLWPRTEVRLRKDIP